MVFKTMSPALSDTSLEANEQILNYIEDLKRETEAKLSSMEIVLERIKEQISSIKEAMA